MFFFWAEHRDHIQFISFQVYRYSRGKLKIRFRKMQHGIMIPMSDNPAKMEIDDEGLIVGVTNRIRTIRYFGEFFIFQN